MKARLLRSFVSSIAMFTLLVATLTICDFIASTIVKDGMSKAYASCSSSSSGSGSSGGNPNSHESSYGENPVASVPEASTLLLMGSGLFAFGLYKTLRSRKRNKNN